MRKVLSFIGALLLCVPAFGQGAGQLPAGYVWGNSTASRAPSAPASIMSIIDRGICLTQGSVLYRNATTWVCLSPGTAGQPLLTGGAAANPSFGTLGVVGGGTNCAAASGTCLDNITGFASTGYLKRTGAGAYSFVAPPIGVSDGGTGIASGTSGGIPYFSGATSIASSAALAQNQIVLGGGAAAAPATLGSLGTTTTVLHGNAAGAPAFSALVSGDFGANIVPNSALAQGGANTWRGNSTGATANVTDNSWTNCNGNNSAVQYTNGTGTGCGTNFANLTVADQTISGGANVTTQTLTTGNITVDCGSRPLQSITNGGAFTITAPASDGSCAVKVTNNGTAGAITFSGFSVGSNTGDALDTTNAHKFLVFIYRVAGDSTYSIKALQ